MPSIAVDTVKEQALGSFWLDIGIHWSRGLHTHIIYIYIYFLEGETEGNNLRLS